MGSRDRKLRTALRSIFLLCFLALYVSSITAKLFRVSFLEDPSNVAEVIQLFEKCGLPLQAATDFRIAISNYFSEPLSFNRSKFPVAQQGWFQFASAEDFLAALPHELWRTEHSYGLTCFDTVLLMNLQNFKTSLQPLDISGPFLPPHTASNGTVSLPPAATAMDAYQLMYPEWIRNQAQKSFAPENQEKRISLMALLFSGHALPLDVDGTTLSIPIEKTLHTKWSRYKVSFPNDPQIILINQVDIKRHLFITVHAASLFKLGDRLLYFEKSGGSGPYILLDLSDPNDLEKWILYSFGDAPKNGYSHLALTFNDT
jgi:hypothetical protein